MNIKTIDELAHRGLLSTVLSIVDGLRLPGLPGLADLPVSGATAALDLDQVERVAAPHHAFGYRNRACSRCRVFWEGYKTVGVEDAGKKKPPSPPPRLGVGDHFSMFSINKKRIQQKTRRFDCVLLGLKRHYFMPAV